MEEVVNVAFENIMVFNDANHINGMVIRQVGTPQHYAISASAKFGIRPSGSVFNVEFTKKGDKLIPHPALVYGWNGIHLGASGNALEKLYMTELYYNLNSRNNGNYPADVFALPGMVMLDGLYKAIHGVTARQKLASTNYRQVISNLYTRLHGDGPEKSFRTPRAMSYYPTEKVVVVTFFLTDSSMVEASGLKTEDREKFHGSAIQIQRFYNNSCWKSLRDLCKDDPKVNRMVRGAIDDGFIVYKDMTPKA